MRNNKEADVFVHAEISPRNLADLCHLAESILSIQQSMCAAGLCGACQHE